MKLHLQTIFLVAFIQSAFSQVVSDGECPSFKPMPVFNIDEFLGTWIEQAYMNFAPNANLKCNYAIFSQTSANNVNIQSFAVNKNTGESAVGSYTASIAGGVMDISVSAGESMKFTILDTDYKTYAATHACKQISPTKKEEHLFLLGRDRALIPRYINKAIASYQANGLDVTNVVLNDQSDCPAVN